jgi:hypothetical protein
MTLPTSSDGKISEGDVSPQNEIDWRPLEGSLPMKHEAKGPRLGGIAAILLGLGWVGLMGKATVAVWREGPVVSGQDLALVGFAAIPGIVCLLYGIGKLLALHRISIESGEVTVTTRGLLGFRHCREPIAAYNGVLKESRYYAEVGRAASRMVYLVKLAHNISAKEIVLYQASSTVFLPPESWEKRWRQYGELFDVPLLEEVAQGIALSQPHDKDIPVQERIRQGAVPFRRVEPLAGKLGRMVRLARKEDAWVLTFRQGWPLGKWAVALGLLTALAAAFSFSDLLPRQHLFYLVWPILMAMLVAGLFLRRRSRRLEQLAVDGRTLLYRHWQRQGGWKTDAVPISAIRAVSVRPDPSRPRVDDLVIELDGRQIRLAWWLPRRTKIRTKDLLLSLIADGP